MRKIHNLLIFQSFFIVVTILSSFYLVKAEVSKEQFFTFKEGLLSVEAKEVPAESIFKNLGEVCGIRIVSNKDAFPSSPVSGSGR